MSGAPEEPSESTTSQVINLADEGHRFWQRKKSYVLQSRPAGKGAFVTVLTSNRPMSQIEVEANPESGWDEANDYIFGEAKDGKIVKPLWAVKKKRSTAKSGNAFMQLEKAVGDAEKEMEPMLGALERLATFGERIRGIGAPQTTGGDGNTGDGTGDLMASILEKQGGAYQAAMVKMAESFGSAMGNISFPWQTPPNFPVWAQMTMNPQFRQGMREMAKEMVDDIVNSVKDGAASLLAPKVDAKTGLTPLQDIIVQEAEEVPVKVEEGVVTEIKAETPPKEEPTEAEPEPTEPAEPEPDAEHVEGEEA